MLLDSISALWKQCDYSQNNYSNDEHMERHIAVT